MIVYNDYLSSNGATFLLIRLYKFIKEIGSFNSLVILCCRYLVNSVLSGVYLLILNRITTQFSHKLLNSRNINAMVCLPYLRVFFPRF